MKNRVLLIAFVCVLAVAVFFVLGRTDQRVVDPERPDIPPFQGVQEQEKTEPPHVVHEHTIMDGQEMSPRIGKATSTLQHVYRENDQWVYGHPEAPEDQPQLEIRFRNPNSSGEMVPCRIRSLLIDSWRESVEPRYRMTPRTNQELRRLAFRKLDDNLVGANAIRVLISDDLEEKDFRGLYMGRKYYMRARKMPDPHSNRELPENLGSFFLRVPDNVPPGKIAVMEIDVTQDYDPFAVEKELVTIRFKRDVPEDVNVFISSASGALMKIEIGSDVTGKREVNELGGALIVGVYRQKELGLVTLFSLKPSYYISSIDRNEVVLPDHADVIFDSTNLMSFSLKVPHDKLDDKAREMALCLHMGKDSPFQLASTPVSSSVKEEGFPETVSMSFIPGNYYLGYITPTGRGIIGRIDIRAEDEGQTLDMQPLEE